MERPLMHGTLDVTIFEAWDRIFEEHHSHRSPGILVSMMCRCYALQEVENSFHIGKGHGHLYATLDLDSARVARTCVVEHQRYNPQWNENFHIYCAHEARYVVVTLKDNLRIGAMVLGKARIPVHNLLSGDTLDGWFDVLDKNEGPHGCWGKIRLRLSFSPAQKHPQWGSGILHRDFPGVPFTFFNQKRGNRVRLYQDAHSCNDYRPPIHLEGGHLYEPQHCWEDAFKTISGAKHLIYIAGWSVDVRITLIRDPERMIKGAQGVTLGDLLKRKAGEGVRVLLLIWDDRTSIPVLARNGLMQTHDEDTESYFKGSGVHCVLCPRHPDNGASVVKGFEVGLMFTHHQKALIVDIAADSTGLSEKRRIASFVGGIDLCDGRYDTQDHSVFRTLNSIHSLDFHQSNFPGASQKRGGPREPWHDVHSCLEGPAAWDVLYNFEQRWKRQGKTGLLLPVHKIKDLLGCDEPATSEDDTETWNSQLFRSIDEGAVLGFPKDPEIASVMGLMKGKENTIDRSIQDGYIHAIRRAKNFIYMENQYFLGSSASWESHRNSGALQLVPMELTVKIVSKIESGERFAVYIVIPMWPEGEPESASMQAILFWQRQTMQMMYKRIARALKGVHSSASPCDYLNFFCLGNRERRHEGEYRPPDSPDHGSDYHRAQQNRRFMIYVHAKTMIVDDEYIIVGSANCNQRSMDGARDSEIAHGSYQPHHLTSPSKPARGQVHGFRMSLWYEHTGRLDDAYLHPESLDCVEKMRKWSQERWEKYVGKEVVDLQGHLLPYPILVDNASGAVRDLPGFENFPDTKAPVQGSKSSLLPSLLTV